MKKHKIAAWLLGFACCFLLTGCGAGGNERYEAEFFGAFDTVTKVVGYADSEEEFREVVSALKEEMEAYHCLFDIYNEYEGISNLKTVNDQAGKAPVAVDEAIIDLLRFAKEMEEKSDGKVNIAMGAVLSIWHDYRERGIDDPQNAALPPDSALLEAVAHTNIDDIVIDAEKSTVFLKDPLMSLDVGAVAKGYAVERVARGLEERGVTCLLISAGGNVRAVGGRADGQPWKVGVRDPAGESDQNLLGTIPLEDASVATSGTYARYYKVDGEQYHHIIDPLTNYPAQYVEMVSVRTADSGLADALSTVLFNLPYEQGREVLAQFPRADALWVLPDGTIHATEGFHFNS